MSETTTVPGVHPDVDAWQPVMAAIEWYRTNVPGGTGKKYAGLVTGFFTWCTAQGWTPRTIPLDALGQYAPHVGAVAGPMTCSAYKSFALMKGAELGLPPLVMPVLPKQKRASPGTRTPKPPRGSEQLPAAYAQEAAAWMQQPAVPPPGVAPIAPAAGPATAAPAPGLAPQFVPQTIAQPSVQAADAFGPGAQMMSMPRPVAPQQRAANNPALSALPPNGKFRIYKNGTGALAGKRVCLPNKYTGFDLQGYADFEDFIARKIVPTYGPMPNEGAVVYEVQLLNEFDYPLPHRAEYTFEGPLANGGNNGGAFGQPNPDTSRMSPMERELMESYKRERDRMMSLLGAGGAAGGEGSLHWQVRDRLDRLERDLERKLEDLRRQEQQAAAAAAIPLPPPIAAPDPGMHVADIARSAIEAASQRASQQAPAVDPMQSMKLAMDMAGNLMDKSIAAIPKPVPEKTGPTAFEQMLLDDRRAAREEAAEARRQHNELMVKLADSNSFDKKVEEFKAMQELLGGGSSQPGPAEVVHAIGGLLNSTGVTAFANAIRGWAPAEQIAARNPGQRAIPAKTAAAAAPAAPQKKKPTVLPANVKQALFGLRDASDDEQMVEAFKAFMMALLAEGGDWAKFAKAIGTDFQKIELEEELQPLVVQIFTALGSYPMLRQSPGLLTRISRALSVQYSAIHEEYFGSPKALIAPSAAPIAPAAAEPTAEASAQDVLVPEAEATATAEAGVEAAPATEEPKSTPKPPPGPPPELDAPDSAFYDPDDVTPGEGEGDGEPPTAATAADVNEAGGQE